jgi:hypothetical protein
MATTNILQYLETTGKSVTTGGDVQLGTNPLNRKQEETFLTESAITAGQLVAVDVTAARMTLDPTGGNSAVTVITADFNAAGTVQKIVVGVAAQAVTGTATSPQPIRVVVRGPVTASNLATVGCTVGDPLVLDTAGAAGACMVNTAANIGHVVCYAMETVAAAGPVKVYVLGSGI